MSSERPILSQGAQAERISVPAGTFLLSPELGAEQLVDAFELDRYPVTNQLFDTFIDEGGYHTAELWDDAGWLWSRKHCLEHPRFLHSDDEHWLQFHTPDRPVIGVSWWEARAYCRFVSGRLPTEREWEAAARGPEGFEYPWGDAWEQSLIGNRGIGSRVTWRVGEYPGAAGWCGHDDLVGNVWQWTEDMFLPQSFENMIAVRGGAWASRAFHCTTHHRNGYEKDGRWSHVGFRVARDI